ncbi:hypothetical protein SAMN00768000_0399 [Sulfobacillus thermosulfidooxidans DSM 9293]|uniref:Uncharacterized protein n=1 Tax=Sulfobacillus thermosulfidooxidans (strain DSM 9293 / VKM B-1269 / AT-1) TaxID=929705 RepID=A0A1W1W7A2_SULTA|nr:hypothetical protein [Sulfobacillus thermosulfidooxidans]SMC02181.1 hypothetical protein SAMN00768000_0399 [Sulfobacillus thermosulfidooxidans DSM 9293]
MNTFLRLVHDQDGCRSIVQTDVYDDILDSLYLGSRTVRFIRPDGEEDYGIVTETLPEHRWEIWNPGKHFNFTDQPDWQFRGEFLDTTWCCPHCRTRLRPDDIQEVLLNVRIEVYRCVNPGCDHCSTRTPIITHTPEVMGAIKTATAVAIHCG